MVGGDGLSLEHTAWPLQTLLIDHSTLSDQIWMQFLHSFQKSTLVDPGSYTDERKSGKTNAE